MSPFVLDPGPVWLPIAFALGAALLFGASAIVSRRGMMHLAPQLAAITSLLATTTIFLVSAPLWMRTEDWFTLGFWVFFANGLLHPMLSIYFWMEAIQRAGATVASTLTATAPLFAAATAIVFLGESITPLIAFGTLLTVAGIVTLSSGPIGITSAMRVALLFATGAAVVRGLNHTVARFGLALMPNPMMAAFTSCTVALVGSLVMYRLRNGTLPRYTSSAGVGWMLATGVMVAGGVTCMYSALEVGQVVVVSPLIATYPLFTLVIALAIGMDRPTRRLFGGVLLVVGGIVAISLARAS